MRAANGVACVILGLFALVQYNDPDALYWFAIYAIAALWCGLAAFRPQVLGGHNALAPLFAVCLIAYALGTVYYWPRGEAWWSGQMIWDSETVREGLGMLIATIGLVLAAPVLWRTMRLAAAR
jgi:hypothetical protein